MFIILFSLGAWADVRAQRIDLKLRNASFDQVLQELRKQTGYAFIYQERLLQQARKVTAEINSTELLDALPQLFRDQPFDYHIEGKVITLSLRSNTGTERPETSDLSATSMVLAYTEVRGRVVDTLGQPLVGATVRVLDASGRRTALATTTDRDGVFLLRNVPEDAQLEFTFVGYVRQVIPARAEIGPIVLRAVPSSLEEVEVMVNTGYQQLPKERATGSFETLTNETLMRSVSSNFINRLEDMTTSLFFDKRRYNINNPTHTDGLLEIRGISSINGTNRPLIVLDNFPFEGDLEEINPNDIQNVTILKDAAATSIWGAQAGNGVIVITTKRGKFDEGQKWSFTSNATVGNKPNLLKLRQWKSSDFIDMEIFLFDQGFYNSQINNARKPALSPVVELLRLKKEGSIDPSDFDIQVNQLRGIDIRTEYMDHFYDTPVQQRYALNFSGGTRQSSYYFSFGHDQDRPSLKKNMSERQTLNLSNNFNWIDGLQINTKVSYTRSNAIIFRDGYNQGSPVYPYARFADEEGNALPINHKYSMRYLDGLEGIGLLDWKYRPLDELHNNDQNSHSNNVLVDVGMNYKILSGLSFDGKAQYGYMNGNGRTLHNLDSYFTRNAINLYTKIENGNLVYQYPYGSTQVQQNSTNRVLAGRAQINYDRNFQGSHQITGMVGTEIRDITSQGEGSQIYGYDEDKLLFTAIDQITRYPTFNNLGGTSSLGNSAFYKIAALDRHVSFYSNLSYSYRDKYILYGSARKDASNLFGATTNGKWSPLWSIGGAWNVHREGFFDQPHVSQFKLRGSYGYSGNVDRSISALSTISYASYLTTYTQLPFASIVNPPNPDLRWERVGTFNVGADFSVFQDRVSGSLDYYIKLAKDLIGSSPYDPTTGIARMYINSANTRGRGLDLSIATKNLRGEFSWNSNLLLSHNQVKISKYMQQVDPTMSYIQEISPIEGQLAHAVFSYKWAGLNPENGKPRGFLNGEVSDDWRSIIQETTREQLNMHGSARPMWFGSVRNDFSVNNFALSFNVTFRLKYFFRRSFLHYGQLSRWNQSVWNPLHADYENRWQQPGDESWTHVPSFIYPIDSYSGSFYQGAELHVLKGDHIRLNDIRMSYQLPVRQKYRLELFAYTNNVGILWRANKEKLDPETPQNEMGLPKTYSFGLNFSLK